MSEPMAATPGAGCGTGMVFSGVNGVRLLELLNAEQQPAMVNAVLGAFAPAMLAGYEQVRIPLWIDSGAYQGNRDLDTYIAQINQHGHHFAHIVALDVINDPAATERHWCRMQEQVSAEYRDRLIYVWQGGAAALLQRRAEGALVGVGGLIAYRRRHGLSALLRRVEEIDHLVAASGGRCHFFGISDYAVIQHHLCRLPSFASVDSARWIRGISSHMLWGTRGERWQCQQLGVLLDPEACARSNVRVMAGWTQPRLQLAMVDLLADEEIE